MVSGLVLQVIEKLCSRSVICIDAVGFNYGVDNHSFIHSLKGFKTMRCQLFFSLVLSFFPSLSLPISVCLCLYPSTLSK
jgi:hypothetical protein